MEGLKMTDYNKIAMDNLNALMREIAEYSRMAEEIGETLDSLKDSLKKYMEENGLDTIAGSEHKASYKAVTSSRIDTTALKRDMPEIAARYTKTTETRRFLFVWGGAKNGFSIPAGFPVRAVGWDSETKLKAHIPAPCGRGEKNFL